MEAIMLIRFVAKDPDSVPDQSPTLYKTDGTAGSYRAGPSAILPR
jgi:hypothetical protein